MGLQRVGEILEHITGLACPHCGAGRDERTVGLVWDLHEQNWGCLICGFREYEMAARLPSLPIKVEWTAL
jgi:rubredoxin